MSELTYGREYIKTSLNNNKPLAYRLKPLWLIGLIPHPGYYNLSIQIINVEQFVDNEFKT